MNDFKRIIDSDCATLKRLIEMNRIELDFARAAVHDLRNRVQVLQTALEVAIEDLRACNCGGDALDFIADLGLIDAD